MTECCNSYGQCDQGPDCPVRETHVGLHTGNGGNAHIDTSDLPITMEDEPIRIMDFVSDVVWLPGWCNDLFRRTI